MSEDIPGTTTAAPSMRSERTLASTSMATPYRESATAMSLNLEAAAAYADRHGPHALLLEQHGTMLHEQYAGKYGNATPHALYSGTKSFWGVAAVAAQEDGLLDLDERVSTTFESWSHDLRKREVTLRQLLHLTSGIGFGGLGNAVPIYAKALTVELKNDPGAVFTYGGIPLQVFGAVLARKLAERDQTPHAYLHARLLDPIGVTVASWRTLADGTQPLPTGAFLTARTWLTYGRFICDSGKANGRQLVAREHLGTCFVGSPANARYGLGWWLAPPGVPDDLVYASGAGGQAMYVVPSLGVVVVRFGERASFNHATFLKRLFS